MVTKLEDHRIKAAAKVKADADKAASIAQHKATKDIPTIKSAADVEALAKRIITGHGAARGLMQRASIAVIAHMAEHGDYTIVYPLTKAANALGRNMRASWFDWMQAHSWLRVNPSIKGAKLDKAEPASLWSRDVSMKPVDNKPLLERAMAKRVEKRGVTTVEIPNEFWTFKAPASPSTEPRNVNLPDKLKRFADSIQAAINEGTLRDASDKPMSYAAAMKLIRDTVETLKPAEIKAGRVKAKAGNAEPVKAKNKPNDAKAA